MIPFCFFLFVSYGMVVLRPYLPIVITANRLGSLLLHRVAGGNWTGVHIREKDVG